LKDESADEQECDDSASDVTEDEDNNEQPQDVPRRYPARVRRRPRFLREETKISGLLFMLKFKPELLNFGQTLEWNFGHNLSA
jgi:hypothetical protein